MKNKSSVLGQIIAYTAFMTVVGVLSTAPAYNPIETDKALIKLSLSHAGNLIGKCRDMTDKELAVIAPNMRRPQICPRERLPIYVEFLLDSEALYSKSIKPVGLWGDGSSYVYEKFMVDPGVHDLTVSLRDSERPEGFDYTSNKKVDIKAGQNYVIDFNSETGGFVFR